MKNIIFNLSLILSLLCTLNCTAQNYHRQDPNADKFAGTWKWGSHINGLTLIMKKENDVQLLENGNDIFDLIIGFHKIYKNGVVTEDTTIFQDTNFIDKKRSIKGITDNNNPNLLVVFMPHKNKNIEIEILYIDSTHIKITDVRNTEGTRLILPGQTAPSSAIDIPNNIILTKQ